MLFNNQGKEVKLPKNINTKEHPSVFVNLREVLIPSERGQGKMFQLQTRARFKQ